MVKQQNKAVRPLVMAILVASAFSAQAADREVFKGGILSHPQVSKHLI